MSEKLIKSLAGTRDILPWQWEKWHALHDAARRQFSIYGYGELATPIIEEAALFIKGTGESTEIVEKQMYTIDAAGEEDSGNAISLRPEGTPPAVRAYLESDLHKKQKFQKFWYSGPMFRREKPQKGRLRQFHQIGVEAIGGDSPLLDAETILLADAIYRDAGLKGYRTCINNIGCEECRPRYRENLRTYLRDRSDELCPDCVRRLDRNVLRILDCKNAPCKETVADMPSITGLLCNGCKDHYRTLKTVLDAQGLDYQEDPHLVRGLDYYTQTVYEIKHEELGARDTICGGGRYDGLVAQMGGPELSCVGFAMGVEATLIAMEAETEPDEATSLNPDVYVVCFDEPARIKCFEQLTMLRGAGLSADMDYEGRSAKAQMRSADRTGADFCMLIGGLEIENCEVTLKDMRSGQQWKAAWDKGADAILDALA